MTETELATGTLPTLSRDAAKALVDAGAADATLRVAVTAVGALSAVFESV